MRRVGLLVVVGLLAGCSSDTEDPNADRPLTQAETASMPTIGIEEILGKLKQPDGKVRLILFWSATREGAAEALKEADALATQHAEAPLEVLALNTDLPAVVRQQALPLLGTLDLQTLEPRAFQGDVMGLGATLDYAWGGQTPAVFLYAHDGKQAFKSYEKGAVSEAAARVPGLLAAAQAPRGG